MKNHYWNYLLLLVALLVHSNSIAQTRHVVLAQDEDPQEEPFKPRLFFVGQGSIQKSLTGGEALPANTGLGFIYYHDLKEPGFFGVKEIELDVSINVASTADSIYSRYNLTNNIIMNQRDFGSYILIPSNSGQAAYVHLRAFFNDTPSKKWYHFFSGFQARFVGSNRVWLNRDSSVVHASALGASFGFFHEFIERNYRLDNDISIYGFINATVRGVHGDAGQRSRDSLRLELLGSKLVRYWGTEAGLGVRFGNLRAELRVPYNPVRVRTNKGINDVPGLTGFQFVTTISFVGGFPLEIKRKAS